MTFENEGPAPEVQEPAAEPTQTPENPPTGGEPPADNKTDEAQPTGAPAERPLSFSQAQVNKIMRSRLDRDRASFFRRYGVKDRDGLDCLIGKAQSYDVMKERYSASKARIAELEERLAFIDNNISPDREDDIRAYFKGKGLDFSEEALAKELSTHPEWMKAVQADTTPKTTIKVLGTDHRDVNIPESEADKRKRIFGV